MMYTNLAGAKLNNPTDVEVDTTTGNVFIADSTNYRIRVVDVTSMILNRNLFIIYFTILRSNNILLSWQFLIFSIWGNLFFILPSFLFFYWADCDYLGWKRFECKYSFIFSVWPKRSIVYEDEFHWIYAHWCSYWFVFCYLFSNARVLTSFKIANATIILPENRCCGADGFSTGSGSFYSVDGILLQFFYMWEPALIFHILYGRYPLRFPLRSRYRQPFASLYVYVRITLLSLYLFLIADFTPTLPPQLSTTTITATTALLMITPLTLYKTISNYTVQIYDNTFNLVS